MTTLYAPELVVATDNPRSLYARTPTGIVIGSSWMRRSTPEQARCISGPHKRTLRQKLAAIWSTI